MRLNMLEEVNGSDKYKCGQGITSSLQNDTARMRLNMLELRFIHRVANTLQYILRWTNNDRYTDAAIMD